MRLAVRRTAPTDPAQSVVWDDWTATREVCWVGSRQGARVEANCSRDPKKLAVDWRTIQGNFGPRGEMMVLGGIKKYKRLEALLANKSIDLVDICNPTRLHPETAIQALAAGKH